MHGKSVIKKLIACLLIIAFSQKMGMGLYLHNWLHSTSSHETALTGDELKNACSCINDFTAPLERSTIQQLPQPSSNTVILAATAVTELPVVGKYFHSLRAPPAPLI